MSVRTTSGRRRVDRREQGRQVGAAGDDLECRRHRRAARACPRAAARCPRRARAGWSRPVLPRPRDDDLRTAGPSASAAVRSLEPAAGRLDAVAHQQQRARRRRAAGHHRDAERLASSRVELDPHPLLAPTPSSARSTAQKYAAASMPRSRPPRRRPLDVTTTSPSCRRAHVSSATRSPRSTRAGGKTPAARSRSSSRASATAGRPSPRRGLAGPRPVQARPDGAEGLLDAWRDHAGETLGLLAVGGEQPPAGPFEVPGQLARLREPAPQVVGEPDVGQRQPRGAGEPLEQLAAARGQLRPLQADPERPDLVPVVTQRHVQHGAGGRVRRRRPGLRTARRRRRATAAPRLRSLCSACVTVRATCGSTSSTASVSESRSTNPDSLEYGSPPLRRPPGRPAGRAAGALRRRGRPATSTVAASQTQVLRRATRPTCRTTSSATTATTSTQAARPIDHRRGRAREAASGPRAHAGARPRRSRGAGRPVDAARGSTPRTVVPRPGRRARRPRVRRGRPAGSPGRRVPTRARTRAGRSRAVVGDREPTCPASAATLISTRVAGGVLDDVLQGLQAAEVDGGLRVDAQRVAVGADAHVHRRAGRRAPRPRRRAVSRPARTSTGGAPPDASPASVSVAAASVRRRVDAAAPGAGFAARLEQRRARPAGPPATAGHRRGCRASAGGAGRPGRATTCWREPCSSAARAAPGRARRARSTVSRALATSSPAWWESSSSSRRSGGRQRDTRRSRDGEHAQQLALVATGQHSAGARDSAASVVRHRAVLGASRPGCAGGRVRAARCSAGQPQGGALARVLWTTTRVSSVSSSAVAGAGEPVDQRADGLPRRQRVPKTSRLHRRCPRRGPARRRRPRR